MNPRPENEARHVTPEHDPRSRFGLYRLCDCPTCEGKGKDPPSFDMRKFPPRRCPDCRGEGRIRQEVASCESPEAVGVALVTLAREGELGELEECPFGLLDRMPPCETCDGEGLIRPAAIGGVRDTCNGCKGSGVKSTGTWLVLPWLPSPRNVTDAARTLARSKKPRPAQ